MLRFWKIYIMTSSNGNIFRVTCHLCGEFTGNISFEYVPKGSNKNISALDYVTARCRAGDKPLSEPMIASFTEAHVLHSASMNEGKCIRKMSNLIISKH